MTLILPIKVPTCKSSDAANFAMPQRSHEVFPLSEKVNGLDLMKKKNHMLRLLRSMVRTNFLCEIVKKKK